MGTFRINPLMVLSEELPSGYPQPKVGDLGSFHDNAGIVLPFPPAQLLDALWNMGYELVWLPHWGPAGESVLAFDPQHVLEIQQGFCMENLRTFCQAHMRVDQSSSSLGPLAGGVFGGLAYEAAFSLDRVRGIKERSLGTPQARFGYYPVVFAHYAQTNSWTLHGDLQGSAAYAKCVESIFRKACVHISANVPATETHAEIPVQLETQVSEEEYSAWVRTVHQAISQGDLYQANLAHPLRIKGSESLPKLFARIHASNPSPWACLWRTPKFALLSNSPELLLTKTGTHLESKPIAGTRPRGADEASDEKQRRNLLRSSKERAEHLMLVDLVRNDLGKICTAGSVHVPLLMDRELYTNVTHIVSTIVGECAPEFDGFAAVQALFPGGTITGTPKLRSMEVIDALESHARGFYTGSFGYIAPNGDLAFNILIRTLQIFENPKGWEGLLHVGAGIVADSNPQREYQETLHKAAAWRSVLGVC